ncbi:MAG: sigma-70 family RNA polymerase sigma factor [Planctomycetes bacterium]|nr:sigma-70 family RNA polymerase sigma factor [Planctomycetota bacterium]
MSHESEKRDPNTPEPKSFDLPEGFRSNETEELVRSAQSGDADALNQLFLRYHGIMLEVARRKLGAKLRRKEEPDDLAQTTFREATRDFKNYEYRGEDSLLRWLIQILQNKIRDKAEFYSASKRDSSHEIALEGQADPEHDTPRHLEPPSHDLSVTRQVQRGESFQLLREAVEKLSDEHRQAITLVFFQGLQLRDAGERMGGKTEDAVRMMLRRAEGKLNEILRHKLGKDPDA